MSGTSVHREKEAFFGGDGRSRLFTAFFFPQKNYREVLNNNDARSIVGTPAWDIMTAGNHEDSTGMNPTDIHPDFTDFIVQTALYHRELDKSTRSGTILDLVSQEVYKEVYNLLSQTPTNLGNISSANLNLSLPALNVTPGTTIQSLLQVNNSNIDTLLGILISIGKDRPAGNSVDQTTLLNFNAPVGNLTLLQYIETFTNAGLMQNVFGSTNVTNSLNQLNNAAPPGSNLINNAKIASKLNLDNVLLNRFSQIINEANRLGINPATVYSRFSVPNEKIGMINAITQAILAGIEEAVANAFSSTYTTASNKYTEQFISKVYGKWDSLSEDSKNFYQSQIRLYKKNMNNKWEEVTSLFENEAKNAANFKDKYRVNLRKVSIGDLRPAFWNLIPKVPVNNVPRIYYYDASGRIQTYNVTSGDEDILRELYMALYQGNTFSQMPGLVNTYDPLRNKNDYPKLWIDKLVRSRLFQVQQKTYEKPKYDEQVFDFVTQNVWMRSGDKLYTIKNGKKIYHNLDDKEFENLLTSSNACFTSGAFEDKENCRLFMNECLLDKNPSNIMNCIRVMEKQDFAQAAKNEINNMTPVVALNLLKRFGFRTYSAFDSEANMNLTKIERVSNWLKNYMKSKFDDKTVQAAIEGNDKILHYLNLVVDFVNSNPAILNSGYSGSTEEKVGKYEVDPYASKLGIPIRRDNTRYKSLYNIDLLDSSLRSGLYGSSLKKPLFLQYSNMSNLRSPFGDYVLPGIGAVMNIQSGGNIMSSFSSRVNEGTISSGTTLLRGIIYNLIKQMGASGKKLNNEYMEKIMQKLEMMGKMEQQLMQNIKYISEYANLLDAIGDNRAESLSEKNLMDIVNTHQNLYTKHGNEERSFVKILQALQSLAYGKDTDGAETIDSDEAREIDLSEYLQ